MGNLKEIKNPISIINKDEFAANAVTFIGDSINTDGNVNILFTSPYDCKLGSDRTYDLFLNKINMSNKQIDRAGEVSADQVINDFLIMNISDLTQYTLNSFISEEFSANPAEIGLYRSELLMENIDIRTIIADYINRFMYPSVRNLYEVYSKNNNMKDPDPSLYLVLLDQSMNGLYSHIVNNIFDRYIENVMNITYAANSLDSLYKKLYKEAYDEECKDIPEVPMCYTFCTSILREIIDQNCINLRLAMTEVAKSAAIMANNIVSKNSGLSCNAKFEKMIKGNIRHE